MGLNPGSEKNAFFTPRVKQCNRCVNVSHKAELVAQVAELQASCSEGPGAKQTVSSP